jgi:hypothetical protein
MDIQTLSDRIDKLESAIDQYIAHKNDQQLQIPLDVISQAIIQKDLVVFVNPFTGAVSNTGYILVNINGIQYKLMTA